MDSINLRIVTTIMIKDLKEVKHNKMAWIPAIVVPLIFIVIIPIMIIISPEIFNVKPDDLLNKQGIGLMRDKLPPNLANEILSLSKTQIYVVLTTGFILAPMFLILPLMFSSIVGADSFAGEKERKTLEGILYTPASDTELFLGKVLASVVPAVFIAWISFAVYTVVLNVVGYNIMGRLWFPLVHWWPLMFWVTPAVSVLGMGSAVLVSSKVNTFMEGYQLSGMLVVPILGLFIMQVTGVIYFSLSMTFLIGFAIWIVDAVVIWFAVKTFSRDKLITRL